MSDDKHSGHIINRTGLPDRFPTNRHEPAFWEALGRVVGTFGFLEDILCKAIFGITATKQYQEDEIEDAFKIWAKTLENALVDPLGNLIIKYEEAIRKSALWNEKFDEISKDIRDVAKYRNAICHGSWGPPDAAGATIPFFIDRKKTPFRTPIDTVFLNNLQKRTASLCCDIIDTVTCMGWQFPGSNGPGKIIWPQPSVKARNS